MLTGVKITNAFKKNFEEIKEEKPKTKKDKYQDYVDEINEQDEKSLIKFKPKIKSMKDYFMAKRMSNKSQNLK